MYTLRSPHMCGATGTLSRHVLCEAPSNWRTHSTEPGTSTEYTSVLYFSGLLFLSLLCWGSGVDMTCSRFSSCWLLRLGLLHVSIPITEWLHAPWGFPSTRLGRPARITVLSGTSPAPGPCTAMPLVPCPLEVPSTAHGTHYWKPYSLCDTPSTGHHMHSARSIVLGRPCTV